MDSKDCPYLLKPGQATRVRSIPFSFHLPGPALAGSFVSTHGRAKLEYIVSSITTGKRGKSHAASGSFLVLPSPTTNTFHLYQHNFNVDIENGGVTAPLTSTVRNIIKVLPNNRIADPEISYPVHLLQGSMQNMSITFPDDRYTLTDVGLSVNSKLSIHAVKSTFSIEEDTIDIPCATNNDSATTKMLSIRVPAEVTESLTLTLKRSTVRKSENLKLSFSYSVRTPQGFVPCAVSGPYDLS